MKNLLGVLNCDERIRRELEEAGIEVVQNSENSEPINEEVPTLVTGKLGSIVFRRGSSYWQARGEIPNSLYHDIPHSLFKHRKIVPRGFISRNSNSFFTCFVIHSEEALELFALLVKKYGL